MITLNDVSRVNGTDVYGPGDDKIGTAVQVYLDNETGAPEWVTVRTGLFGMKELFVPLADASFTGERVEVPYEKDKIKNAPRIDPDGDLTPAEEEELYTYYGVTGDGRTGTTRSATDYARTDDLRTDLRTDDDRTDRDAAARDTTAGRADTGRDTSGPTTDDAMTRSEERLVTGTRTEQAGKARLRKYVVTEQQQVSVPVSREEVRLEREPVTDANRDRAFDGPDISEEEHEVTLHAERPVVDTEAVPVERVRLAKETVTDEETVGGEVRKEQIELDDDTRRGR
jgi:uncharacterized protein (TIGR02271 family)